MDQKKILLAGAAASVGLFGYAWLENRCMLETARYHLVHPRYRGRPLRLMLISDLHCVRERNFSRVLYQKARQLSPDYILIAGDLISRSVSDFTPIQSVLRALSPVAPTYCCPGNHELDLAPEMRERLYKTIVQSGVTLLDNASCTPECGLRIVGARLKRSIYRDENNSFFNLEDYTAEELYSAVGAHEDFTLLLAHNPLCMDAYAAWGAELVFSGHVHGGALRLPVVGGVLSPERVFFPKYDKGFYKDGSTVMLVSGGIGKLRLFNPPQLCLLTLTSGTG